ncbi:MAG: outer membrane beta-barrel protein [Chitinophagaceae bacterium]|nr:outer membrane beta-barrel protein [Chitinophagaceae bacterium]
MKKLFALVVAVSSSYFVFSQDSTVVNLPADTIPETIDSLPIKDPNDLIDETERENKQKAKLNLQQLALANRSKDHLLIQVGYDNWANKNDSINTTGLSRSFSMYLMFDFPFKTNPHLSIAVGAGVSTSNIYFKDTYIDIAGRQGNRLTFNNVSSTDHFKKYKLLTTYLEAPVEFRYLVNPDRPKKSLKFAAGVKAGLLVGAGTKGKNLLNGSGQNINSLIQKEKSKRYFNTARIGGLARIGYGNVSLFGTYQLNQFIKEGFGPDVRPYSIGLTLSGL